MGLDPMDTNHNVNVTYQQKASLGTNKAFQVIVGVLTLLVLIKMFFGSIFSGMWFSFKGVQPDPNGMGSMALIALLIDTLALVGLGSLTIYKFLWSFLVEVYEYWAFAVAKGKAMAQGNQQATAIGVAAAMGSIANEVSQAVSNTAKPRKSVEERLTILNGNDKEFKRITDVQAATIADIEARLAVVEITTGLREAPLPPPPTVEEELAALKAKLSELEESKTSARKASTK